ncbi:MAG: 50S ribosomal protein L10 [Chitinophagia bacterium]|nr:50S ribosomal protein L10 [Chitinophagia bacterium]
MTPAQKNEAIEQLKEKLNKYENFYITNTEKLTVEQVNKLRRFCFEKKIEMKVAKNTLIRKAMEQIDPERFKESYDSLHGVTALLFSESGKEPALLISSFRSGANTDKPVLKAAYIGGAVFTGDDQLETLKTIKGKYELLGEIIGLLQSPAKNVISALNAGNKLAALVKALEDRGNA